MVAQRASMELTSTAGGKPNVQFTDKMTHNHREETTDNPHKDSVDNQTERLRELKETPKIPKADICTTVSKDGVELEFDWGEECYIRSDAYSRVRR